ncbi:MAG: prepilin-type N-terminal cleavage/methylation domain-containing protein [Pseudomonadota bacterium]
MRRRRGISRGFSLIEALVALAIAAAVITGFYAALSTGLQLRAKADKQAEAVLLAASVLDRVGVDIPLQIGTQQEGEDPAGRWTLVISNRPPPDMSAVRMGDGTLAFISVAVRGEQEVVLRSMRYLQSPL